MFFYVKTKKRIIMYIFSVKIIVKYINFIDKATLVEYNLITKYSFNRLLDEQNKLKAKSE